MAQGKLFPSLKDFLKISFTFILATLGWIIFRADNIDIAISYFARLFDYNLWGNPYLTNKVFIFLPLIIMIISEWLHRGCEHGFTLSGVKNKAVRYVLYFSLTFLVLINMGPEQSFIYFQF